MVIISNSESFGLPPKAYCKPNGYIVKRKLNRSSRLRQKSLKAANDIPIKSKLFGDQISTRPLVVFFGLRAGRWGEISPRGSETQTNETIRLLWNITIK